jgi:hypothetical protein
VREFLKAESHSSFLLSSFCWRIMIKGHMILCKKCINFENKNKNKNNNAQRTRLRGAGARDYYYYHDVVDDDECVEHGIHNSNNDNNKNNDNDNERRSQYARRRRGVLVVLLASSSLSYSTSALAAAEDEFSSRYKKFDGKATRGKFFQFEYPKDWVIAVDRECFEEEKRNETKVVVGNFRDVVTASVRVEIMDSITRAAFEKAEEEEKAENDANVAAEIIAKQFTSTEREAAAGKIAQDLVAGVENNRSGVMKFKDVGEAKTTVDERGRKYYSFESISEVCRAEIEEIGQGKKICVGPKGDELETIDRRAITVITRMPNTQDAYYVLKMSAKSVDFDKVQSSFAHVLNTFRTLY